ncbi:DEAD/DEAH box helicase [Jiella avicenniae]|uniref:DEAD/DEAH box helicase n=1 Tax=Jiella avicenniae TaxID=2907202 RepID=A0A9X1T7J8_9HYPH|nr:DEAD/DEAH box helicase [Jiella avicenniae]MCE7030984.1 DEAD/DEAH box helicase [Jiella avicenniae]
MADAFEALVVLDVQTERMRSTAFVAASARQVLAQIERLHISQDAPAVLREDVIGADLAASLLFLIAQRSSDAFEASRTIRAAGEPRAIRRALILAVLRYARGRFTEILEIQDFEKVEPHSDAVEYAADLLFQQLLVGLRMLAEAGLGLRDSGAIEEALVIFSRVQNESIDDEIREADPYLGTVRSTSIFAGPHHLAALLEKAGRALFEDALVFTPPPTGVDETRWTEWLKSEASRWPFLWENHRDAIATGYLQPGSSLVMTTPTGSGKTTLAALKVASTLAAGKTVVYLAPTHALVGQVETDLNERVVSLAKAESIDQVDIIETVDQLPDIAVVTPERCYALLIFAPQLFSNVGLLVFDEFHLLGAAKLSSGIASIDRRSIDAMLCLLTFQRVQQNADYLFLSAMVSNGEEIAAWLSALTCRAVTDFDYKWKPTRQLKSCIVYDSKRLRELAQSLRSAETKKVAAIPQGIFSLSNGWNPSAPEKIALRPFSEADVPLGIGGRRGRRYLTSNRYQVAAFIAKRFAEGGLKVIVFCESIVTCGSVAKIINQSDTQIETQLDDRQQYLRAQAVAELGSEGAIYDVGSMPAAVHHGELISDERRLVESFFRNRENNLSVLAATSTLAQGLNLPCDVVILASSDRLDETDPEERKRSPLHPHEVLNALGRAGRAGHASTGFAIVVPSTPVGIDNESKRVTSDEELKVVFAEGDQCLPIADPLGLLFDEIEVAGKPSPQADYLLRRLALSIGEERDGIEAFATLTKRTFSYFQRYKANPSSADAWLVTRQKIVAEALAARENPPSLPWQEELAAKVGAPVTFISRLAQAYAEAPFDAVDAMSWLEWLLSHLEPKSEEFEIFLRPENTIRVFGRAITNQDTEEEANSIARDGTLLAMRAWFSGEPLIDLESKISEFIAANEGVVKRPTRADPHAKHARRFALRLAPDLSFLCGLFVQIAKKLSDEGGVVVRPLITFLPQLTRLGFPTAYHYLLSRRLETTARPTVAEAFASIEGRLERLPTDSFEQIRDKLEAIYLIDGFSSVDDLTDDEIDELLRPIEQGDDG